MRLKDDMYLKAHYGLSIDVSACGNYELARANVGSANTEGGAQHLVNKADAAATAQIEVGLQASMTETIVTGNRSMAMV